MLCGQAEELLKIRRGRLFGEASVAGDLLIGEEFERHGPGPYDLRSAGSAAVIEPASRSAIYRQSLHSGSSKAYLSVMEGVGFGGRHACLIYSVSSSMPETGWVRRTMARYRAAGAARAGESCAGGGVGPEHLAGQAAPRWPKSSRQNSAASPTTDLDHRTCSGPRVPPKIGVPLPVGDSRRSTVGYQG